MEKTGLEHSCRSRNSSVLVLLGILAIVSGSILSSCNGTPDGVGSAGSDYTLQAYLVGDMERDTSFVRAFFRRDSVMIPGGPLTLDTFLMDFDSADSLFKADFGAANTIGSGIRKLTVFDGAAEVSAQNTIMVGGLTMNIVTPANRQYTSTDGAVVANLTTLSQNASGYVIGIVPAGEEYTGAGYSTFISLNGSSGSIPPEFFRDSLDNNSLRVGTYYIYMYAFNGSPQIDSRTTDLPTILPVDGFAPNITLETLSGSIGSLVVSRRDTLVVTDTP